MTWLLAMQSKDGGWAAFDVDNNWHSLSAVPFADHNAMLDPTCPDITGRVMEGLIASGVEGESSRDPARRRIFDPYPGSRWKLVRALGCGLRLWNLPQALRAPRSGPGSAIGEAYILRAVASGCVPFRMPMAAGAKAAPVTIRTRSWLRRVPSQTAWAVLGFRGRRYHRSGSLHKGIEYFDQRLGKADGSWDEALCTGTGFPQVFYLKYHLYRDSFPVLAMSSYLKSRGANGADRI